MRLTKRLKLWLTLWASILPIFLFGQPNLFLEQAFLIKAYLENPMNEDPTLVNWPSFIDRASFDFYNIPVGCKSMKILYDAPRAYQNDSLRCSLHNKLHSYCVEAQFNKGGLLSKMLILEISTATNCKNETKQYIDRFNVTSTDTLLSYNLEIVPERQQLGIKDWKTNVYKVPYSYIEKDTNRSVRGNLTLSIQSYDNKSIHNLNCMHYTIASHQHKGVIEDDLKTEIETSLTSSTKLSSKFFITDNSARLIDIHFITKIFRNQSFHISALYDKDNRLKAIRKKHIKGFPKGEKEQNVRKYYDLDINGNWLIREFSGNQYDLREIEYW